MSYILDALRKSDQQRQRGMTPTLHAVPATVVAIKQPALLFYILLAAGLLGTGVAIGWLHPWQTPAPTPESKPIAAKPPTSDLGQSPPVSQPMLPVTGTTAEMQMPSQQVVSSVPATVALTDDKPPSEQIVPPKPVVATQKESARPFPEKPAISASSDAAPGQGVRTMAELPAAIRQEIPKMSISGHVYSAEAEGRLVGINDQLVREGESPAPGLILEQITPDGMIFSYRKYRFRRDAQ